VAEVDTDAALDRYRRRHAVHYVRLRLDLSVYDVPLLVDEWALAYRPDGHVDTGRGHFVGCPRRTGSRIVAIERMYVWLCSSSAARTIRPRGTTVSLPAHSERSPPAGGSAEGLLPRLLDEVNQAGGRRDRTRHLARLVEPADSVAGRAVNAADALPVVPELAALLPSGVLRRGGVYQGAGSGSLLWTLIAGAMTGGAWCAVVGLPTIAHASAVAPEFSVDLSRLAFVNAPGPQWPAVVAALLDGIDLVIVAPPPEVSAGTVRQLRAKARTHGAVLVCTNPWPDEPVSWPDVDLTLTVTGQHTIGLGQGRGRIRRRAITVRAQGRGAATRPQQTTLEMPPASLRSGRAEPDGFRLDVAPIQRPGSSTGLDVESAGSSTGDPTSP